MVARHILGIEYYPVSVVIQTPRLSASLEVFKVSEEGMKLGHLFALLVLVEVYFSAERIAGAEINLVLPFSLLESVMTEFAVKVNM